MGQKRKKKTFLGADLVQRCVTQTLSLFSLSTDAASAASTKDSDSAQRRRSGRRHQCQRAEQRVTAHSCEKSTQCYTENGSTAPPAARRGVKSVSFPVRNCPSVQGRPRWSHPAGRHPHWARGAPYRRIYGGTQSS